MGLFTNTRAANFVSTTEQRIQQASTQLSNFNGTVADVYANWLGYNSVETDETQRTATRLEFSQITREMVDTQKAGLAQALDIIAGGILDENGNPLTRQNLLDELAAVVV